MTGFNARLREVEAALARTEQSLDYAEAGLTRVREAYDQAQDDWSAGTSTGGRIVTVRETARPAWGLAVGDSLVGRAPLAERSTPARETTAAAGAKAFADDWGERMFAASGCPRPLTLEDLEAVEAIERETRARRPQALQSPHGAGLVQYWDRATGGRP